MAQVKHISIDIETFSDVDLKKAGLYRYAESPAFDILLIAWAVDRGLVRIVDLTVDPGADGAGANYIALQDFYRDLYDPDTILHAYNAAFEHGCINTWLRRQGRPEIPLNRWRCTMAHGLYCGYTAGLAATGEAMGLPQDKRKLGIGGALIRKFCVPQKPTKARPYATRIWPHDEPEKWELFKTYCRQDVETEREIERRLSKWPMPDREQRLWELTTEANLGGVGVDMELVRSAIAVGEAEQTDMLAEARQISGLENPKSVQQLMKWLNAELDTEGETEITDLRKQTVVELLQTGVGSDKAERMLELRQLMSKTSTKKYDALEAAVCADGRVKGMMFYYGANRTGRWAGRIVQPQNLPQNHLDSLDFARERVKARDTEMVKVAFGSVPDTLSQLIRTAFVPADGKRFAVADYSAIEARVVAWLAGETWVLDAFRAGKDIYCATASQMFGVPVEKHGENAHLRQRGKVATLACIAEGSLVLTHRGLKRIETVQLDDLLWDGESWVRHDGVIYKGEREVMTYDGLTATPDHLVFIEGESKPVRFDVAAACGAHLTRTGAGGQALRLAEDYQLSAQMGQELESLPGADRVSGLRISTVDVPGQYENRENQGLSALLTAEAGPEVAGEATHGGEATLHESERSKLSALRGAGDPVRLSERDRGGAVSDSDLWLARQGDGDRPDQQQRALRARESSICDTKGEHCEPGDHCFEPVRPETLAVRRDHRAQEAVSGLDAGSDHPRCGDGGIREAEELEMHPKTAKVYDIRNAGRRHRFTVSGTLVHNCGYGGGLGALIAMGGDKLGLSDDEMQNVINRWRQANPAIGGLWRRVEDAAMRTVRTGEPQTVQIKVYDPDRARENEARTRAAPGSYSDYFRVGAAITFRRETDPATDQDFLTVELPTRRKLFYARPRLAPAPRFPDRMSLQYMSVNQTSKKWAATDTWGGKLVENITQAVARDCLAETLLRLREMGLTAAFHVHDEVIVEVDDPGQLDDVLAVMAAPLDWAPGLPLKGAGFVCDYYQKD